MCVGGRVKWALECKMPICLDLGIKISLDLPEQNQKRAMEENLRNLRFGIVVEGRQYRQRHALERRVPDSQRVT